MAMIWIDDCGHLWNGSAVELRRAFDSPYSNGDFTDYAVRCLGFVAIDRFGRSVQIRLAPARVSQLAMQRLASWTREAHSSRFVLAVIDEHWIYEAHLSLASLERRLAAIAARAIGQPAAIIESRIDNRDASGDTPLHGLLAMWKARRTSGTFEELRASAFRIFGAMHIVVEAVGDRPDLVITDLGDGYRFYSEDWRRRAAGCPLKDQPDRNYGAWSHSTYAEAHATGEARLSRVDAIISTGSTRNRLRFMRLIMPCVTAAGKRVMLAGSLADENVDLRLPAPAELVHSTEIDLFHPARQAAHRSAADRLRSLTALPAAS